MDLVGVAGKTGGETVELCQQRTGILRNINLTKGYQIVPSIAGDSQTIRWRCSVH